MNTKMPSLRKRFLFLLIPALLGLAYLGSTVLSSSTKKDKTVVRVNNLTRSCELLNVEKHKDHIKISVQNNSDRVITAFVLTSRIDSSTVYTCGEEFAFSEADTVIAPGIPPGQSYDRRIGIPGGLDRQSEIILNLSAIIFEDKSSEGDPKTIRDLEDNRLGRKMQLVKAFPIIDKLSRLSDEEISSSWNRTAKPDLEVALSAPSVISSLKPNKGDLGNGDPNKESEQFQLGVQAGTEIALQKYQELEDILEKQGSVALRDGVVRLRNHYAKLIDRL